MVAISLKQCAVTDQGCKALSGTTKLKEFDVFRTRVGGDSLLAVAGAQELTARSSCEDSAITTRGIVEPRIGQFPNLTALDLSETTIDDDALVEIGELTKLRRHRSRWRSRVTDRGTESLVKLPLEPLKPWTIPPSGTQRFHPSPRSEHLEFIHSGKTAITDEGIQGLQQLTNLKDLVLTNTGLSPEAVKRLQGRLPKTKIQIRK
jgi:hypothetical protein